MSAEEYWHGDPCIYAAYREAEVFRQERNNYESWLQGRYIYEALQATFAAFSYGMSGKKGQKPDPYTQYPYAITEREREAERQRRAEFTRKFFASHGKV